MFTFTLLTCFSVTTIYFNQTASINMHLKIAHTIKNNIFYEAIAFSQHKKMRKQSMSFLIMQSS